MTRKTLQPDNSYLSTGLDSDDEVNLQKSFDKARDLVVELHSIGLTVARDAAFETVNALLASMTGLCRRAAPPADIEMTTDGNGDLIYRCKHKKPHTWKV